MMFRGRALRRLVGEKHKHMRSRASGALTGMAALPEHYHMSLHGTRQTIEARARRRSSRLCPAMSTCPADCRMMIRRFA